MADVDHVVSLGLGSPASIEHFMLFGLSPHEAPLADPVIRDFAGSAETALEFSGALGVLEFAGSRE